MKEYAKAINIQFKIDKSNIEHLRDSLKSLQDVSPIDDKNIQKMKSLMTDITRQIGSLSEKTDFESLKASFEEAFRRIDLINSDQMKSLKSQLLAVYEDLQHIDLFKNAGQAAKKIETASEKIPETIHIDQIPKVSIDSVPEIKIQSLPEIKVGDIPELKAEAPELKIESTELKAPEIQMPEMPELKAPEISELKVENIPELKVENIPELKAPEMPKMPELKALEIPEIPELKIGELPELKSTEIKTPVLPELKTSKIEPPEIPELHIEPLPEVKAPELPELKISGIKVPELPELKVEFPEIKAPEITTPEFGELPELKMPEFGESSEIKIEPEVNTEKFEQAHETVEDLFSDVESVIEPDVDVKNIKDRFSKLYDDIDDELGSLNIQRLIDDLGIGSEISKDQVKALSKQNDEYRKQSQLITQIKSQLRVLDKVETPESDTAKVILQRELDRLQSQVGDTDKWDDKFSKLKDTLSGFKVSIIDEDQLSSIQEQFSAFDKRAEQIDNLKDSIEALNKLGTKESKDAAAKLNKQLKELESKGKKPDEKLGEGLSVLGEALQNLKIPGAINLVGVKNLQTGLMALSAMFIDQLTKAFNGIVEKINNMVQYGAMTSSKVRDLKLGYGMSSSEAYGFSQAQEMLGLDSFEDMFWMNSTQLKLFREAFQKYNDYYQRTMTPAFVHQQIEYQVKMKEFVNDMQHSVVEFIMTNKDAIMDVMRMILKATEWIASKFSEIVQFFHGGERSTDEKMRDTYSILNSAVTNNSKTTNMNVSNTFNNPRAEDKLWLSNSQQLAYRQIIDVLERQ